jgi:hypothetical protein
MYKVLLLLCALTLLTYAPPATAARPSAYTRAKLKGRIYVHRPNYKLYRGRKRQHRSWVGRLLPQRQQSQPSRSRL